MSRHILMVADSYPPLIGGATRATQLLSRALVRRGYRVTVATLAQEGTPDEEDDEGVSVRRLKGLSSWLSFLSADTTRRQPTPFPDPITVWQLRRLVKCLQPDIVQSYGWITYSAAAAVLGTAIPLLISARDYSNICPVRTLIRNTSSGEEACDGPAPVKCLTCATRYYGMPKAAVAVGGVLSGRVLLRCRMQALHSCSSYVQGMMRRHLLGRDRVIECIIPDFRDEADGGAPDPLILSHLPAEPFILFVGALRLCKGLRPLFAAYGRLHAPPPLVLMGTVAYDTPREFPEGVTVLYNVPHATVMAAWRHALFGVAPSTLPEPLGNVVHEAMSQGRPVIGTVPGGMGDMITDGESGFLVPAGNSEALAAAMRRLIDDAALRDRLGRAAEVEAQRFTAQVVVPRFEALYDDILASTSNGGIAV